MAFSHFTQEQLLPLLIGAPLILLSIGLFKGKPRLALGLLFGGVLCFGFFMAGLDPFLNLWDEQFHALVAKNLSADPFFPKLYPEPVLEHDHRDWTSSHVWLHKEPLFLWQMALSIGFFGTNELAVRLPSVLMHAITVLFIYRIGRIMVNRMTGFYGALLYGVAYFPLILIVGQVPTDHNDIAFVFYVTCSFWGCFEYQRSKKRGWLLVIGVASGGAVLVKWLMGFLVFFNWALSILIVKGRDRFRPRTYYPLFGAVLVAVMVSLPWQLYIYSAFPEVASYEMTQKAMHFSKAVEDHTGRFAFHFTKGVNKIYGHGVLVPILLLLGLVLLIRMTKEAFLRCMVLGAVLFVYLFFSLAATKMVAFTLIVAPFLFLGWSSLIERVVTWVDWKVRAVPAAIVRFLIPLMMAFMVLKLNKIERYHSMRVPHDNNNRIGNLVEMDLIDSLSEKLKGEHIIFNTRITAEGHIPFMFYTEHLAFNFIPTRAELKKALGTEKGVAVLDLGKLPDHIKEHPQVRILEVEEADRLIKRFY